MLQGDIYLFTSELARSCKFFTGSEDGLNEGGM